MEKDTKNTIISKNSHKIFFSSDFHYAHQNICFGTSSWGEKEKNCRMFDTVEQMNEAIIKSINDVVGEDDELYFMGDLCFGGIENIWNTRKQIKCKNIHFITGNHDHHIKKNKVLPNCHWDYTLGELIVDGAPENIFGEGHVGNEYFHVYAHDLFKTVNEFLTITVDKKEIILCHYPLEQWLNMDRGSWHVHGHTHHKIDNEEMNTKYRRIDVGWPTILSFDDLKEIMDKREIKSH
jgi:calcineurin-like phosphoesterase family protein